MTQRKSEILKSGLRQVSLGKKIHLKDFLPSFMEQGEVGDFIVFFENFLNTLYYNEVSARGINDDFDIDSDGVHTYYATCATSDGDYVTSADTTYGGTSAVPIRYQITSADTISILEKTKRITELHDPDLIDITYIQRLANLLGYNVTIDKSEISDFTYGINADTEEDINSYLRFVVSNLPNWYKIKTTKDAIKVLLYSFGIIGDIIYRWTSDNITSASPSVGGYGDDDSLWREKDSGVSNNIAIRNVPENYFPTPHFKIRIDANNSPSSWFQHVDKIIKSIETIRPINNVFRAISVYFQQTFDSIAVRMDTYDRIKSTFPINDVIPEWSSSVDIIVDTMVTSDIIIESLSNTDIIVET